MTLRQKSDPLTVCADRAPVSGRLTADTRQPTAPRGLTIVEMLVAMAITLLIMAAVVTVFANITGSVSRRRATIEMSSALRNVRETLARDLAGATCPAIPWQRPEANQGYIEIIEGPQNDYYPSPWLFDGDGDGTGDPIGNVPGIDLTLSSLPGSNLGGTVANDFKGLGWLIGSTTPLPVDSNIPTDGRGLGDGDDTLMLTVRNEKNPFVGRIPSRANGSTPSNSGFAAWSQNAEEVESPLAEVVWYALENPVDPNRTFAFGEPGFRTIYRRALLILPDLEYQIDVVPNGIDFNPNSLAGVLSAPGVVRVLDDSVGRDRADLALASLIAFQERYDLSVRLEWDPLLPNASGSGRWVLKANTLGDLTKRENRYEHHGFVFTPNRNGLWLTRQGTTAPYGDRFFPFAAISAGEHSNAATINPIYIIDPELGGTGASGFRAVTVPLGGGATTVVAFVRDAGGSGGSYATRPYVYLDNASDTPATARAILNEDGQIVHMTPGMAPLGGPRRGEDVMMTDALAFDIRVYDPGAPVYSYYASGSSATPADVVVQPGDPGWLVAYQRDAATTVVGDNSPALSTNYRFAFERQGAYVDLGYGLSYIDPAVDPTNIIDRFRRTIGLPDRWTASVAAGRVNSPFFADGGIRNATGPNGISPTPLTRLFATYDTWSWHYENNGVNEDGDRPDGTLRSNQADLASTDEGSNGLDDLTVYGDDTNGDGVIDATNVAARFGPDDYAERETRPPYDAALRGVQVSLRAYERDSRQIREVRVRESFVPE